MSTETGIASLTRAEAEHRAGGITVTSYHVELDLTLADDTFSPARRSGSPARPCGPSSR